MTNKLMKLLAGGVAALAIGAPAFAAGTNSNQVSVGLTANIVSSLTLTSLTPAQDFGTVTANSTTTALIPVTVTSAWTLGSGQTVKIFAYFNSASAAMTGTNTGTTIPVSAFTGSVDLGAAQAFSATNPFGGSNAIQIFSQTLNLLTSVGGHLDTLNLTMNLNGVNVQADSYTGTMYIQAQAL
jgi:hypothetical protein